MYCNLTLALETEVWETVLVASIAIVGLILIAHQWLTVGYTRHNMWDVRAMVMSAVEPWWSKMCVLGASGRGQVK